VLTYFGTLYDLPRAYLRERIDTLMRELEMTSFSHRACGTLSSGQKQRANIARAFLHDPDCLILDEPTTALDVVSGRFVVEAIRQKKAEGKAVLFSTHIMGEAEYLCDRIALMHEGRIIDEGPLDDLLARSGRANLTDAFLHHVAP
jgi:sodium transport system ATP-binding protein